MIYIATHKKVNIPSMDGYSLIQVGAEGKENFGYLCDNTGSNISNKNKNFCELTALYWAWKNTHDSIVGLVHYRRFFYIGRGTSMHTLSEEEAYKLLKSYDMIIPQETVMLRDTVKTNYEKKHYIKDLLNCREIISKKCPEYLPEFDKVLNKHSYYPFNMFICKRELFEEYMEWVFGILFELESITDISEYDEYNKRIFGFLSERLFNVWLLHHKSLKVKELKVLNPELNMKSQIFKSYVDRVKKLVLKIG